MARPQFNPTDDQRKLVKSLAAMGTRQEDIAAKIGLRSPKTLRKNFRSELTTGAVEANYKVMHTLFEMATSGKCPAATIFWAKTRGGLRERPADDHRPVTAPPPFIVQLEPARCAA